MKNTNIFILLIIFTLFSIGSASATSNAHIVDAYPDGDNVIILPDRALTDEDILTIEYDFGNVSLSYFEIGFIDPLESGFNLLVEPDLVPSGVIEINMSDINPEVTFLYESNEYKAIEIAAEADMEFYEYRVFLLMESDDPDEPITPPDEDGLQSLLLSILAPFIVLFLVLLILKEFGLIKDLGGKNK